MKPWILQICEVRISWCPMFFFFFFFFFIYISCVYFSRGTLPTKKGVRKGTTGDLARTRTPN